MNPVPLPNNHACELCERTVANLTIHHLVPRSQGKRKQVLPTVKLCPACHRQLHVLFSNRRLAQSLSSLDEIRREPSMQTFLAWVRPQDPNKRVRHTRHAGRPKRR